MDAKVIKLYRQIRAKQEGIPASSAYRWALALAEDQPDWEWSNDGRRVTFEHEGYSILVRVEDDEDPDISYLGTFSDRFEDGAIRNSSSDRNSYKWFVPMTSAREYKQALSELGYSRAAAYALALEYVRRDMETAREYRVYVVIVTASREGVELGSDVLGGIDIDEGETWQDSRAQIQSMITDHGMIDTAIAEANETLAKLAETMSA